MDQVRVRRPDDTVSALGEAQAEIDIVKSDAKIYFVEPAELLENRFAQDHACSGHGRAILLKHGTIEVAGMPPWNMRKGVAGYASQPENDSAMLQRPVGIPKPRAYRADLRLESVADHFGEPAGIVDLGIVVEKDEKVAPRFHRRAIVQAGIVERARVIENADRLSPLRSPEEGQRPFFFGTVIDHENFKRRVIGPRPDALHATLQ